MTEEKRVVKIPHNLILENRKALTLTGVSDVGSFDDQVIEVKTDLGELVIKGEGLHISKLSLETGDLSVEGEIGQLSYSYAPKKSGGSVLSRLFQ
ncbi:MAG: sporulation protein YabP [Oscillospiraceae bacterium]|jgi:sporulation protein YabP|nr:sporulation protein YabP [Oscillospiraceae bacterium]